MIPGMLKANDLNEISELLKSEEALSMIERDPYWPKWDSPWWYMQLLEETGKIKDVSQEVLKSLLISADRQYLVDFPAYQAVASSNGCTDIMCFCFLGTLMRFASKLEVDLFAYLPWAASWIKKYQLPDGGYNCDELAYSKSKKSSMISSVCMLEGMIEYSKFSDDKEIFTDNILAIVRYLLKHNIYLSSSAKKIEDAEWEKLIFPRFYEYDFSRGLEAILDFLEFSGKKVRRAPLEKAIKLLNDKIKLGLSHSEKQWLSDEKTVSYYIEEPILFRDNANVPLVMRLLNSKKANEYVPAILERISQKLNNVSSQIVE